MGRKKIVIIIGARPQFIKIMPLMKSIKNAFNATVIHTGQHYDYRMSKIFFEELDIPSPDYNLNVGSGRQGAQTARMIERIENVLFHRRPDLVVILGDTNSTLAGALAAAKMNIPIAHIESGLRSFRRSMPEEINRIVGDSLSSVLFCPTGNAVKNLAREGIKKNVIMTGDIMCDALRMAVAACRNNELIKRLGINKKDYYLLTIHRDFNTNCKAGLRSLLQNLSRLDRKIIFPVHPRTRKAIKSYGLWNGIIRKGSNIMVLEPQGYMDFLTLQLHASVIITDSGGVQKEAYMLKVPCVTLRDETEWVETLKGNANRLAGRYGRKVVEKVQAVKDGQNWRKNVFGDGNASARMIRAIHSFLNQG